MQGSAAQAAPGRADDGFVRRVEREAERLRRLSLAAAQRYRRVLFLGALSQGVFLCAT